MKDLLIVIVIAFMLSAACTGFYRKYALARRLMDVPNPRSAHHLPTPRGGGIAFGVTFLSGTAVLGWMGRVPSSLMYALLGAAGLALAIGCADDHIGLRARSRLLVHILAALWALLWMPTLPQIAILGFPISADVIGYLLAALYLIWLLNLYNFMDGIDGIAGMEAITICAAAVLLLPSSLENEWLILALLAAAVAGFLIWNLPSAKIFMGDSGSGFLGIVIGILSIYLGTLDASLFWACAILVGAFVVDATVTLFRRLWRGDKIYEAHHSHAYQHAARALGSHLAVTGAFAVVNVAWLLPMAWAVVQQKLDGFTGLLIAYAPLVVAAYLLGAGLPNGRLARS